MSIENTEKECDESIEIRNLQIMDIEKYPEALKTCGMK